MEAALVFDTEGRTLDWHVPSDRSAGALPDSHRLWELLWENRERLGGVAHTHPWEGAAWFSQTDVTTFAAVEDGLGRRLLWPVVTFTEVATFAWVGPGRLDYAAVAEERRPRIPEESIERLRVLSR
jgi:hypothetical protein